MVSNCNKTFISNLKVTVFLYDLALSNTHFNDESADVLKRNRAHPLKTVSNGK